MKNRKPEILLIAAILLSPFVVNSQDFRWEKLPAVSFPGKQDDIAFVNENKGWYVNGGGNVYYTTDGGLNWQNQLEQKGTFFRTINFIDEKRGFAGTVGTDYFPNVLDTIPLYRTLDGGKTWSPVSYEGPYVKGICAIDVVQETYINHGELAKRTSIFAVGRVGSPANIMISHDEGETWKSRSMNSECKMLFDIKMFNMKEGIACAASSELISESNALILKTSDGGKTWRKVYQSSRPYETTWKASFPTRTVGYVTIQSYNPDDTVVQQRLAKTVDGGETWQEIDLVRDHKAREFGVGFIDELTGFVGTTNSGYKTLDGGLSWMPVNMGRACNKVRIYKNEEDDVYGYAIGVDVLKLKK